MQRINLLRRIEGKINYCFNRRVTALFGCSFVFIIQSDGLVISTFDFTSAINLYIMKLVINLKLDFQQDSEKAKPTKVAPYVRVRNGKKELVKGYTLKKKGL